MQRYPVVFLCDYIIVALLILFSGMWFAKKAKIGSGFYKFWVNNRPDMTFVVAILIFVVIFTVVGVVLLNLYKAKDGKNTVS